MIISKSLSRLIIGSFFFTYLYSRRNHPLLWKERRMTAGHLLLFFFMRKGEIFVKESQFQAQLIKDIRKLFPGCIVLKNDPEYIQGFPDLTIFYRDKWALLECKRSSDAPHQPNQDFYISHANEMSFARFICPENKEEVLHDLQSTFGS